MSTLCMHLDLLVDERTDGQWHIVGSHESLVSWEVYCLMVEGERMVVLSLEKEQEGGCIAV